ncbi:uncharacterized protein KQ657_001599 [Scheffersomyces spartinae]|uniref:Uncharacterized protein n=1 Tax=Scheffersomyces spartinae TaxID=45513 RepID=A0A9P7V6X6_9ASCO|nr:uncharacterized protein KQ657_001599 [Scheffersomyces spartinae]KAG7192504.1 hypothetical protein KQ657_001599 [Scheffersomyces spartinae]
MTQSEEDVGTDMSQTDNEKSDPETAKAAEQAEKAERTQPTEHYDDPDLDKGYAWVICIAIFILNFNTWGMNSGFAVYLSDYINNNVYPGTSKEQYSFIGGISFGVGLALTPVINYIYGIIGVKTTVIMGNCMQFAGLFLASFTTKYWQLVLTQGLLNSFGLAFIALPAITLLPQYFKKKRTMAAGLATAGAGAGGIVYNLGMQKILQVKSVHWALRAQCIIAFGLIWISIFLIRSRAQHHKIVFTAYDPQVIRSPGFYMLTSYIVFCMFAYTILLYTMVNFTTSLGYSGYQGSIASALVAAGSVIGRPFTGVIGDRGGPITVAAIVYAICAIFTFSMWIPARNLATVYVFSVIIGGLMGCVYTSIGAICARLSGLKKMNVTFSMVWVFMGLAGIFSPVIGLKLKQGSGGYVDPTQYLHCQIFVGFSFVGCSLSAFLLRGYIIARDKVHDDSDTMVDLDGDVLHLGTDMKSVLKGVFQLRSKRIV